VIGYYIASQEAKAINDTRGLTDKSTREPPVLKIIRRPLFAGGTPDNLASLAGVGYIEAAFCILLVAAILIGFNNGISVGLSNHSGLLPVVRRILDPDYLPGDFGISVRLYHHRVFAYLVAGFAAVFGEDFGLILLTVLGMTLLSFSLFSLCRTVGLGLPGCLAAGLLVATKPGWTGLGLELNNFVGNPDIMPTTFAHAFILLSISSLIERRFKSAALTAGAVLMLHLQIGLIFALAILPLFATKVRSFAPTTLVTLPILFLLPGSISLFHFYQMIEQGLVSSSFSLDYINFRHPHHFELQSIGAAVWTLVHLAIQVVCYLRLRSQPAKRGIGTLLVLSLCFALLSALHFLDYYYLGIGTIAKIQFLRMSPFITVFGAISLVVALYSWSERTSKLIGNSRQLVHAGLFLIVISWSIYFMVSHPNEYYFGVRKYSEQKSGWADINLWVRNHGPRDTVYLTPPDRGGFTCMADRSNVVEFKINPDGGLYLEQWYERLRDVSGGSLPTERGFLNYPFLRESYTNLRKDEVLRLGEKYKADFAVLPIKSTADFEILYQNRQYKLVRLKAGDVP
jgi:hypothetical protein